MAKQWKPHRKGNYVDKVTEVTTEFAKQNPTGVHHIHVFHDDWCDLIQGKGVCNCNPVVKKPYKHGSQN